MATVTKFEIPPLRTPRDPTDNATKFSIDIVVANGDAAAADDIAVLTPPAGARIVGAALRQSGSIGATTTAQLRLGTAALTAATTAAAASGVLQNAYLAAANGTDKLNILIGTAAISVGATLTVTGIMILPNG